MKVWIVQRDTTECLYGYPDTQTDIMFVASSEEKALEYILNIPNIVVTEYAPYSTPLGESEGFTSYTTEDEDKDVEFFIQEMTVDQAE